MMENESTPTMHHCFTAEPPDDFRKRGAQAQRVRMVRGWEVDTNARQNVLVLKLHDGVQAEGPLVFSLSVPAATQLSRHLRKAVKEYLRAVPGTDDQTQGDQDLT